MHTSGGMGSSASRSDEELAFRLNSFLGEKDQVEPGESERADRLCVTVEGAVASRRAVEAGINDGGGLGLVYLSLGFMVLMSVSRIEVRDALRFLRLRSTGTHSVLTVCPGRYGQPVVHGFVESCTSVVPSNSY
jgi:hypothetical protein